ncbi:MAG TPA: S1 RNA-binding domain-containing protein, partial [Chloroflexota bacterium]|nr:S1 RNA-binding domain-containing protein [Chloroflexota bacterium]
MDRPSEHDAPPPASDSEALRGTRFEFGGRRPYSFVPPRVAERAAGRPLPGIGTVAIGQVSRLVPYGAFVDFLGFRGMIHISQ